MPVPLQQSHLQPGYRLDRYELLYPLAQGGMATVWVARLTGKHGFEKLVAIKTILPQYADDPEFQTMFLDEARIAARIRHPNVAEILDLGEEERTLFLVMEWVDGDSLARLYNSVIKAQAKFPLNVLVRIAADCCAGLHAAHELSDDLGQTLGVVHRDVSPQNVLVGVNGVTKLIDFGVAKAANRMTQETSAGLVKGKIQYASPEQAMGKALDRRSDIWALGTVLYQVLSGKLPYDGENQLATLHLLTSGKPPKPLPPQVPPQLAAIVRKALSYKPEDRFSTARDMQLALEGCMSPQPAASDVAAIVKQYLGDRADQRKAQVTEAIAAVSSRGRPRGPESVLAQGPQRVGGPSAPGVMGGPNGGNPASWPGAMGAGGSAPGGPTSGVVALPPMAWPPQASSPGPLAASQQTPLPTFQEGLPTQGSAGKLRAVHYMGGAVALLFTACVWTGVAVVAMRGRASDASTLSDARPAGAPDPAAPATTAKGAAVDAPPAATSAAPAATSAAPPPIAPPPVAPPPVAALTTADPAPPAPPVAPPVGPQAKADPPAMKGPPQVGGPVRIPPAGGAVAPKKKKNKHDDGF